MLTRRAVLAAIPLAVLTSRARAAPATRYAVVIGDSIAEGEIERHGRLNVQGRFVPDYPSQPGQLSYELAVFSGVFHFNHGIGGQVSDAVRARWPRDALAQSFDPGDGRGTRTLPENTRPELLYLHVGINDIALGVPLATLQDNFSYFARSAADNRIVLVVDTIGSWLGMTDAMIQTTQQFNDWLVTTLARRFRNMSVVDYADWSTGGTRDLRMLAPGKFADGVHPSAQGYADYARFIRANLKLPPTSPVRY